SARISASACVPWGTSAPDEEQLKLATVASIALAAGLASPAGTPEIKEPRTGVTFPVKDGDTTLLGLGVRTKTFLKVKVYAAGLYVAAAVFGIWLGEKPIQEDLKRDLVSRAPQVLPAP